ncbi:hypothetical protein F4825DRAFT_415745 [Nemania diffusa]|nr:hypothetical protein F4825DRAFT_415745 [Nemania diffusa]
MRPSQKIRSFAAPLCLLLTRPVYRRLLSPGVFSRSSPLGDTIDVILGPNIKHPHSPVSSSWTVGAAMFTVQDAAARTL